MHVQWMLCKDNSEDSTDDYVCIMATIGLQYSSSWIPIAMHTMLVNKIWSFIEHVLIKGILIEGMFT